MDNILFDRFAINVTFRCTLKCKLCCVYVPYYPKPVPHYSYEELAKCAKRIFELADYVRIFTVTGGEPLLHKQLPEVFDYLRQFRNNIGRLELITSGTLIPNDKLTISLKNSDARVLMDDYGPALSTKADEVVSVLEAIGVPCERRYQRDDDKGAYCEGWFNVLEFSEFPISYEEGKKLFSDCLQANVLRCNPTINGKIYVCPAYEYCVRLGKIPLDPDLYIDLYDDVTPLPEQKEKVRKFLEIDHQPSCRYCNGFLTTSRRFVPGEQLP